MLRKRAKQFPTKELNKWLRGRAKWSHADWETLLNSLNQKGYDAWTNTKEKRDNIGFYLETNTEATEA